MDLKSMSDEELTQKLNWAVDNNAGGPMASAASGLLITRAVKRFDDSSSKLGRRMLWLTEAMLALTGVLAWLTWELLRSPAK